MDLAGLTRPPGAYLRPLGYIVADRPDRRGGDSIALTNGLPGVKASCVDVSWLSKASATGTNGDLVPTNRRFSVA